MMTATAQEGLRTVPAFALGDLASVLARRSADFTDEVVDVRDVHMDADDGNLVVGNSRYPLQTHALTQLGTKLGIPAGYLQRCEPDLRANNVNRWLDELDGPVLVRYDRAEVRALLSTRYRPLDNHEVVNAMLGVLPEDSRLRFELTATRMEVQLVGSDGDGSLRNGLHLTNSEVGAASVSLSALIYRGICLNGLIMGHGSYTWSKRHIGATDLQHAFQEQVPHLIEASAEARGMFKGTTAIVVKDHEKAFERVAERYQLTKQQHAAIMQAYAEEPGVSLYHVINAVTRAGNHPELSLEPRRQLQEVGGRMLTLASEGKRWLD